MREALQVKPVHRIQQIAYQRQPNGIGDRHLAASEQAQHGVVQVVVLIYTIDTGVNIYN